MRAREILTLIAAAYFWLNMSGLSIAFDFFGNGTRRSQSDELQRQQKEIEQNRAEIEALKRERQENNFEEQDQQRRYPKSRRSYSYTPEDSNVDTGAVATDEVAYEFRAQSGDTLKWLENNGFEFKMDATNTSRARIGLDNDGLTLETLAPAEPIIARSNINIAQPSRLTVTWGVNHYPVGANWDAGANNEAIMVMVFFGTEKFSGGFFMPPSPYFIGFFLCENGRRGVAISGRSYTRQGRYICVDGPSPGKKITSIIALDEHFRNAFGTSRVPPITGFAIEADTTQVGRNGRSSAWIKSIKITSAN